LKSHPVSLFLCFSVLSFFSLVLTSCGSANDQQAFQATLPQQATAPIYTPTPTVTASFTPTITVTPSLTPTLTPTPTLTVTPSTTPSPTLTPSVTPTVPLWTLTPVSAVSAPPADQSGPAAQSLASGWSCDDFPCQEDIAGFMQRIQVPAGYTLEHVGAFPGQPMQISYGPDGRLYATVLENGTRTGAVYAMNDNGTTERYSGTLISPIGLAFQPGTDVLYVSGRVTPEQGGGLWRIPPGGGMPEAVITDLPCCFMVVDNQPNGLTFGPDGYLYLGVGSLTDHDEVPEGQRQQRPDIQPYEASILRIQPHTGKIQVYASGLRNPFDLTFDSHSQMYATDSGLLAGPGDRLLAVNQGANYGWPYWRSLGCDDCPFQPGAVDVTPNLVNFPNMSLPRGLVAYTGSQFPANLFDSLFVVLWNGIDGGQRIVRIDPKSVSSPDYVPEPFVTGLIRPVDVTVAPDGSLVVVDFVYGHVWRVRYTG